jgi:hypothetical protein
MALCKSLTQEIDQSFAKIGIIACELLAQFFDLRCDQIALNQRPAASRRR